MDPEDVEDNTCETLGITPDIKHWIKSLGRDYHQLKQTLIEEILQEVDTWKQEISQSQNSLKPNAPCPFIDGSDRN